jgi:uncharacterized protein (DUF1684 family)
VWAAILRTRSSARGPGAAAPWAFIDFKGGKTGFRMATGAQVTAERQAGNDSGFEAGFLRPRRSAADRGLHDVRDQARVPYGIRLRDLRSKMRQEFQRASVVPRPPELSDHREVRVPPKAPDVGCAQCFRRSGTAADTRIRGVRFRRRTHRLHPTVLEGDQFFFVFKDGTSARTTYGAGRFLYADMPKDGKVILDFNKAYNPPCAYTPYATCPLPPKPNRMTPKIEAGELNYGDH